jgi:hypothetical protein
MPNVKAQMSSEVQMIKLALPVPRGDSVIIASGGERGRVRDERIGEWKKSRLV